MNAEVVIPPDRKDEDVLLGAIRQEAWDTLQDIMKSSPSEKMRVLCAMAILDRTEGVGLPPAQAQLPKPKAVTATPSEPVKIDAAAKQREDRARLFSAIIKRPDRVWTAPIAAKDLNLTEGQAGALLVQLARETMIARVGQGMYQAVKEP